jgi:transcriptional regulator with XRE-family HTH domain
MFGDIVRALRRRLGLTQEELADRAGLSVRGVRKIESGRSDTPRAVTVRLLADVFGLAGDEREQFRRAALGPGGDHTGAPAAGVVPPAQLPAKVAGFTGRPLS